MSKDYKKVGYTDDEIRNRVINASQNAKGGIVRLFYDLELYFTPELLNEIGRLYEDGYTPEDIGKSLNRDPDEIFLGLFHLARHDKIDKEFARR